MPQDLVLSTAQNVTSGVLNTLWHQAVISWHVICFPAIRYPYSAKPRRTR